MRQAKHIEVVDRLENEGWRFDHTALVNRYRYAGTVTPMQTRKGMEYCRVHHGECVGHRSYQVTTVMSKKKEN